MAADGEGASKLITIRVGGTNRDIQARKIGKAVANSPLVKTAIYGRQANWGRVIAAAGRAGVDMREEQCDIWFNRHQVVSGGLAVEQALAAATGELEFPELLIRIALGVGSGTATVWTSDLTEEYIRINGSYIS